MRTALLVAAIALPSFAASTAELDAAVDRLAVATRTRLGPADLNVAALQARVALLEKDVALARPRFGGEPPAEVGQGEAYVAWVNRRDQFRKADGELGLAQRALAMELAMKAYQDARSGETARKAQAATDAYCKRLRSDEELYAVCGARQRELSGAVAGLAVSDFAAGATLPEQALAWQGERARASFTLAAGGARLVFRGPVTDLELDARRPGDRKARLELVDCKAASGGGFGGAGGSTSIAGCRPVRVAFSGGPAVVTLGDGDAIWLRGPAGPVTVVARKKGASLSAAENLLDEPAPGSAPSGRLLADFLVREPRPAAGVVSAAEVFASVPRAFVVYGKTEVPLVDQYGAKATLAPGEPVLLLDERTLLRVNGEQTSLELSPERRDYYAQRKVSPLDDLLSVERPAALSLPKVAPAKAPLTIDVYHDLDLGSFAGLEDKRVAAFLKARAPVKACVVKELDASGSGAGLDLVTRNPDGSIQNVKPLTGVLEDRASKRCKLQALLKQRAALLAQLEKDALARTRKLLEAP